MSLCDSCTRFYTHEYDNGEKFCRYHRDKTRDAKKRYLRRRDDERRFMMLNFRDKSRYITEYVENYGVLPEDTCVRDLSYGRFSRIEKVARLLDGYMQVIALVQKYWWRMMVRGVQYDIYCEEETCFRLVQKSYLFETSDSKCALSLPVLWLCVRGKYFNVDVCGYLQYLLERSLREGVVPEWVPDKRKLWSYFEVNGFFEGWKVALKVTGVRFEGNKMILETAHGDMMVGDARRKAEKLIRKPTATIGPIEYIDISDDE